MAVIIFLWLGNDGYHASLNIDDRPTVAQIDRYISFYPKGKGFGTVTGTPSMGQSVLYDTQNFKTPPEYASAPILGLDEDAIIAWWRKNRGVVQYSAFSFNCADAVLSALEAGGANQRGPLIVNSIQRARKFISLPDSIENVANLLAATNPLPGATGVVRANASWQAMPLTCGGKGTLRVTATGNWTFNPKVGAVGPGGAVQYSTQGRSTYAFSGVGGKEGQLIGKIGNGKPFIVGTSCSYALSPADVGSLMLVINDDLGSNNGAGLRDNGGTLNVTLQLIQGSQASPSPPGNTSTITGPGMGTPPVSSLGPPPTAPTIGFGPIRR